MNTNEYIASGIIEQYVLGDVSPQEKKEVECMSHIYPEIQAELMQVQQALEGFAMDNAIEVSKHVKQNIFNQIEKEEVELKATVIPTTPTVKVVSINKEQPIATSINYKKYLVAASIIFVVAIAGMFAVLNNNYNIKQLAANNKINDLEKSLTATKQQLTEQSLFNTNNYVLQGNAIKAPNKSLTVTWNKQTGNVFVSNVSLPQTPTNKQYQLWGLKDGKPVDLGVFDVTTSLQAMKNIQGMQAFAVTLENKGGSPTPHLEELYAIVNI